MLKIVPQLRCAIVIIMLVYEYFWNYNWDTYTKAKGVDTKHSQETIFCYLRYYYCTGLISKLLCTYAMLSISSPISEQRSIFLGHKKQSQNFSLSYMRGEKWRCFKMSQIFETVN